MRTDLSPALYRGEADFRYQLECFLRAWHRTADRLGLTAKEYDLMLVIRGARRGSEIGIGDVARRLLIYSHDVHTFLRRLEKRKFVRRYRDPTKHRVLLRMTPAGEAVLRKLVQDSLADLWHEGLNLEKAIARMVRN